MSKLNCWEFKKCGKCPNELKDSESVICPACTNKNANGINDGTNGGRICWAIAGTLCGGNVQGEFASKLKNCMICDFYKLVLQEQGKDWKGAKYILDFLNQN